MADDRAPYNGTVKEYWPAVCFALFSDYMLLIQAKEKEEGTKYKDTQVPETQVAREEKHK